MQTGFYIKKVAVLGAGVMGAQIAAHCVNAGIETLLFDLCAKEGDPNGIVTKALAHLSKLKPTPLATPHTKNFIKACNYDDHLSKLSSCDLIIEAIAEQFNWKVDLYRLISPWLTKRSILVSNTSGLSINRLASVLSAAQQTRFCGVHFFNPPRYMHLAELIPSKDTSLTLLDNLETWLTRYLGKGVVRAKDTPNFIANRIGVFSLLATLHHAEAMGLGFDVVDALTGTILGRPKSATFRTMDVVGLDTMQHVVETMREQLARDPWVNFFTLPTWLLGLIREGHLGQKSDQGIYRKNTQGIEIYDMKQGGYRLAQSVISDEVRKILIQSDPKVRMRELLASNHIQAQFLVACFRDLFHYTAFHLEEIAETVREVDLAMRWGFGWQQGPFETWQAVGIKTMKVAIDEAIQQGDTMSTVQLPTWLETLSSFYQQDGAYAPKDSQFKAQSTLPVYSRQIFLNHGSGELACHTNVLYENEGICLSSIQNDIAMLYFKTKSNTIGQSVIDGFNRALDVAEAQCKGLIIYQQDATNFSSGADLSQVAALIRDHKMVALDAMIQAFQQLMMRIKYNVIPVVAALRGRALGGGCELILHASKVIAAFESYPGLVESGVGLIPAGGGCKEMAIRAAAISQRADLFGNIKSYFEQIAMAVIAGSAPDALARGYLREPDRWVMHQDEVLYVAINQIESMLIENYQPPRSTTFPIAGREGYARLQLGLVNWLEGGFISEHDYFLSNQLAKVICGGDLDEGSLVDERWMFTLEREAFMTLASTSLSQTRIVSLLASGKPLRN